MTTLYRGIAPTGGLDKDVAYDLAASGDREGALAMVLDFLSANNPDSALGIGRHWSTDRSVSKQWSKSPFALNILMEARWDGNGEDLERTNTFGDWDDEEEITLLPGTPLELVSLTINSSYQGEIELISSPRTITADLRTMKTESAGGLTVTAHRTAAEPGGVLPWVPSQNGYYWITKNDDSLEAVTNDGVNRMRLYEKPWGWEWVVRDNQGVVEKGNFGSAMSPDAIRDRADQLLAEFDTHAQMRTRGPSRGYQHDYTPAPNELWGRRASTSDRYREMMTKHGVRHVDSGHVQSDLVWEPSEDQGLL